MEVEIWSDVVCPWCYIGKRRFERALTSFPDGDAVKIRYRSFQLDPRPAADDMTLAEVLAAKYHVSLQEAARMHDRVTTVAADEGLTYALDLAQPSNTFDAHRLSHLADAEGRQADLVERLFAAYFTQGRRIDDLDELARIADEAGLSATETQGTLTGDRFAEEVRGDIRLARSFG